MIKLTDIINELNINKTSIKIIPSNTNGGTITINGYDCIYRINSNDVEIELNDIIDLYINIDLEDEEYYPVEESERACNDYFNMLSRYFGTDISIKEDNYDCSYISVPIEDWNKRFKNTKSSIVKSLGNNIFEYKGNILILKELTPQELNGYVSEYQLISMITYPHMPYDTLEKFLYGEKGTYSENYYFNYFYGHYKFYFILDKNGNYFKSMYNPGMGKINAVFQVPKDKNLEDYKLDLINYFNRYFPN